MDKQPFCALLAAIILSGRFKATVDQDFQREVGDAIRVAKMILRMTERDPDLKG